MKPETFATVFVGAVIVGVAFWAGPAVLPVALFLGLLAWWGREAWLPQLRREVSRRRR